MSYNKKKKIKSSSLIESVVALSLISIVISISMMVFFNVTNGVNNQTRYHKMLDRLEFIKNESGKAESEKKYSFLNYSIIKKTKEIKDKGFSFIEILVYNKNKEILKKTYIIKSEKF